MSVLMVVLLLAGNGVVQVGDIIAVDLKADIDEDVYRWEAIIWWESDAFELIDVRYGDLWGGGNQVTPVVGQEYVKMEEWSVIPARYGDVTMATVLLRAKRDGLHSVESLIHLDGGQAVYRTKEICSTFCVGDLDGDARRTVFDWPLDALGCARGDPCFVACADIDGDAVVTEADLSYIKGLWHFPCPPTPRLWLPVIERFCRGGRHVVCSR